MIKSKTTATWLAFLAGGLGLHLIRRLVDSWNYEYSKPARESRITFRKTLAGKPAPDNASTTRGA